MLSEMENFGVCEPRELIEIGQQSEYGVALLDRTECQLFDDQMVAADFVIGQQADETRSAARRWSIHTDVSTRTTGRCPPPRSA